MIVPKAGFRFVKRYRANPGSINFEQDVNRYDLDGAAVAAGQPDRRNRKALGGASDTWRANSMISLPSLLSLIHLIGLALGVGCATAKLTLLLRCKADQAFLPAYMAVARPVTRLIISGLALLTLSGAGWLLVGYRFTPLLFTKLAMVGTIWVLGPIIDNVIEPQFRKLAPTSGEPASPAFIGIMRRYLLLEGIATGLFYAIVVMWVLA